MWPIAADGAPAGSLRALMISGGTATFSIRLDRAVLAVTAAILVAIAARLSPRLAE